MRLLKPVFGSLTWILTCVTTQNDFALYRLVFAKYNWSSNASELIASDLAVLGSGLGRARGEGGGFELLFSL